MRTALLATLMAALLPAAAGRSEQPCSSPRFSVSGVVVDPSGAVVSGARVTLRGISRSTDASGEFRFDPVPAGIYEVQVHHQGFDLAKAGLTIGIDPPAPLRIVLTIAQLRHGITVDGSPGRSGANPADNLDVVRLDRQMLDRLPVFGHDIVGAAARFLNPAAVGSNGVTVVVDGLETSQKKVPRSNIQAVQINQNPYSAEYSRPGDGRIEIFTRAGSPEYHGEVKLGLRDHRLDAHNAFAARRPPEQHRSVDGSLTGPLGRGKNATFLLSASREDQDLQSVIYALTPAGAVRENFPNPQRDTSLSARVTRQAGSANTVSVEYNFERWSARNDGVGGFTLPEAASDSGHQAHHVDYALTTIATPRLINLLRLRTGRSQSYTRSARAGVPRIDVLDAFTGGGAQVDYLGRELRFQLSDSLSWSRGKHFLQAGLSVPEISRSSSTDSANIDGAFSFATLDDYARGTPFSFVRQQGESHLAFGYQEMGLFVQDSIRIRPNLAIALGVRYDRQSYLADGNNFAPRFSVVFAPGKNRNTVLRAGAGVYYNPTGPAAVADVLRLDGRRLRQIVLANPVYPDPWSGRDEPTAESSSVVRFAPDLRSPYSMQYSFGVERQLQKSMALIANYTHVRGVKLFRSRDLNSPLPPLFQRRPDPSIGMWRQVESSASLSSHALRLALRGDMGRFFRGMVQYSLARAYDNASGIGSFPADSHDLSREWSRANFDERHRFFLYGSAKAGKLFDLGVMLSLGSGRPYSLTTGRDLNQDGFAQDRPAGVGRNTRQGPGSAILDLRWSREFSLTREGKDRGRSVSIGMDAFNVLNRVNYTSLVGNLSSPFFGRPVSAGSARRMQIFVDFEF